MRHIGHDVVHALFHVDHSILALIKALALRPGRVAREYVEGRRKQILRSVRVPGDHRRPRQLHGRGHRRAMVRADHRQPRAGILQRHFNLVILLQMPVLAATVLLLFWKERLHFAEHLVLVGVHRRIPHACVLAASPRR